MRKSVPNSQVKISPVESCIDKIDEDFCSVKVKHALKAFFHAHNCLIFINR